MSTLTRMLRNVIWSRKVFEAGQRMGVNFTRNRFYSPIPDTRELQKKGMRWDEPSEVVGLDLNIDAQLRMLGEGLAQYKEELDFPLDRPATPGFYWHNAAFGLEDAAVLHCMVRHAKPGRLIEVGSGFSTFISARASLMNQEEGHRCKTISIEPYPRRSHQEGFAGLDEQIPKKVEEIELDVFEQLQENDILFIDSSHVVSTGNDVNFLFLEVLPRLKRGVIVHVHDIFVPYEYPEDMVINNRAFFSEQYLLQAFLCFNRSFEVIMANYYLIKQYPEKMKAVFAHPAGYRQRNIPNSFWMRKIQ